MPRTATRGRFLRARLVGDLNINVLIAFGFGVVYLTAILWLATSDTTISSGLWQVMKVILALAAAGIGAAIPGTISVNIKGIVRAGGAIALFAIVFFFPAATIPGKVESAGGLTTRPAGTGLTRATEWLGLLDADQPREAWERLAAEAKPVFPEEEFVQLYTSVRKPLGKVLERTLISSEEFRNPPGYPPGIYHAYLWSTKFEHMLAYEWIILVPKDGGWRVFRFTVGPQTRPQR